MNEAADIEAQAAAWIARCDADGGEQDPQLAAWLIADPRHRAAYLRLLQVWERTRWLGRLRPADSRIDPDLLGPSRASHFRAHLRRRSSALTLQLPAATMQVVAASATNTPMVSKFIAPSWIR